MRTGQGALSLNGRRPLSRVRPSARIIRVMYPVRGSELTSAVRCGFATLLFPRPPWSSGQSGSHCVARSRFGLPPTRPPRRGSPEAKTKGKTKKDRFRANRKEVVLACPGQGSSVLGPSRPGPSGAPLRYAALTALRALLIGKGNQAQQENTP